MGSVAARILVVDDDPEVLEALCQMLVGLGHAPDPARDGKEALSRYRIGAYDLVMTDLAMPEMNGLELIRRLRAIDPTLRIILLTATLPDVQQGLAPLEIEVARKPIGLQALARLIDKVRTQENVR